MNARSVYSQNGFSLLEAIVALVLVTMLSITSFTWISNLLLSVGKIEENAFSNAKQRNVTEFLSDINMMSQTTGNKNMGGVNIQWSASLIEPIKRAKSMDGGDNPFEVGLYKVAVQVQELNGERVEFELIQVGFRALPDEIFQ